MSITSTEYMLEQWGYWLRSGAGIPRYTSPSLALVRDNVGSTVPTAVITDDDAEKVDRAVARLGKRDKEMGDCVWLHYAEKRTYHGIAKRLGIGKSKAAELVRAGVAWVDGALDSEECTLTA